MEHNFWHQRWQEGRIGFHQADFNPWLQQFWSKLIVKPGTRVLVPLCGKSRDMLWLREQGYEVLGMELSDIACRDFFHEQGVEVEAITIDNYHRRERDGIVLLTGDIFELPWEVFRGIGAVYDRAALIALPPAMRRRYAERLAQRIEPGVEMLLVTLELAGDDRSQFSVSEGDGPPFSVFESEVRDLFEPAFTVITLAAGERVETPRGLEREVAYLLHRQ
ncbi:thiopurine S-methyltransferase [Marinobacterium zhoushanense]|uniref:Thiopurine S-methyltransferase n=1 Tax=Marinobacterium zhoushanense TaxID=1679163 RepID=A0ABQ1KL55_9GAMM|nr:thiopurine S-methyltransferase [Marinobacterium zhoushanense]GGC03656.1 thiopurine S-methyltransferase [Marinobacterium zhoushanense]